MDIFSQVIGNVSAFLGAHTALSYSVLFLGAFFETLIGVGFFVYGEIFFLSGSIIAGAGTLNVWLVALSLIAGGVCGDSSSYFIGTKVGTSIFKENNKVFSLTNYKKGEDFFNKYGIKSVFFARLLGPLSWITPFLAGTYHINYRKFLMYNIPGVMIGIGEFIIVGYFFGQSYKKVLAFVQQEMAIALFLAILVLIIAYDIKRNEAGFYGRTKSRFKQWHDGHR